MLFICVVFKYYVNYFGCAEYAEEWYSEQKDLLLSAIMSINLFPAKETDAFMKSNNISTIRDFFRKSVARHAHCEALGIVGEKAFTYQELYSAVVHEALKLKVLGIKEGDKVAILSASNPCWGISYLAVSFAGATVVPVLNDFSNKEIQNILSHSESKAIYVSQTLRKKLIGLELPFIEYIIDSESFIVEDVRNNSINKDLTISDLHLDEDPEKIFGKIQSDSTAAIIYTSGTTGHSKGVMLSHRNIISNIEAIAHYQKIVAGDRFLSVLPLSHTYECTLGFLMALFKGASIYYLGGPPSASVLLPALKKIKPTMMLTVPLVIENIYKRNVRPALTSGFAKYFFKIKSTRVLLSRIAGKKLMETFGGQLHFFGIGGSRLESETERFLSEARFPYAIGYGLTETAPLLAAAVPGDTRHCSAGFALPGQELKLINVNAETGEGEIVVRGENVMQGYYKDEELTRNAFTSDRWFKTGDLGFLDKQNRLYIKGRLKNLVLGANGENIYPEEIEAVLNQHQYVVDAIVYEWRGKMVAKVHLDYDAVENHFNQLKNSARHLQHDMQQHIHNTLDDIKACVNSEVRSFSRIADIIEQQVPFEKTPTLKIKKYLYV